MLPIDPIAATEFDVNNVTVPPAPALLKAVTMLLLLNVWVLEEVMV